MSLQKFVKVQKIKKLWIDNEIKHLATKKPQQYQNFMRTKDKNDQLKLIALRNKLQKLIRRKKEMYYQRLMNADGQKNSKSFFDCISRLKGKDQPIKRHRKIGSIKRQLINS